MKTARVGYGGFRNVDDDNAPIGYLRKNYRLRFGVKFLWTCKKSETKSENSTVESEQIRH